MKLMSWISKYIPVSIKRVINERWRKISLFVNRPNVRTELEQIKSALKFEHNMLPIPPRHLQIRVVGAYSENFIESGYQTYKTILQAFNSINIKIENYRNIYDFGCGCGRVIRAFHYNLPNANIYGSDIDPEAIDWLNSNYSHIARFSTNQKDPPTKFENYYFDLIYSISIFTHLPEKMQLLWLKELHRLTHEQSIIFITTHGESIWGGLRKKYKSIMIEKGFLYLRYGKTPGLPEFYDTAFHAENYIKQEWGKYFKILNIIPAGLDNHQDIILMKKIDNQD